MPKSSVDHRTETIPILLSVAMLANVESLSPSVQKQWRVVESWIALGVPLSIHPPVPVTREELARAHDREFVDVVLDCRVPNGFYAKAKAVSAALPFTNGAMLAAARLPWPKVAWQ
jgi:hypothetical protein